MNYIYYTKLAYYVSIFYMYSHIEFWMPMHNILKTTIYSLASTSLICMYFDSKNIVISVVKVVQARQNQPNF